MLNQGKLWAGTASGLFKVDPRTDRYTQPLSYETTGGVSLLLPLGDGRLWAEGDRGHFYYNGHQWSQVRISGLSRDSRLVEEPVVAVAIDKNDDLWIDEFEPDLRVPRLYHLPGHIPPSEQPWIATSEAPFWRYSDRCQWQAFTNGHSSYHSTAECEAQDNALESVGPYPLNGYYYYYATYRLSSATDQDGSLWWISGQLGEDLSTGVSNSPPISLNHLSSGRLVTFTLSSGYNPYYDQFAYPLAPDPIHGVWRGDRHGLVYTNGTQTRRIDFDTDQCIAPWPNDLTIDASGTVWLGTENGQILKQAFGETNWTAITLPDLPQSKPGQSITAIAISPDGKLWATHGCDLFNVNGTPLVRQVLSDVGCGLIHLIATDDTVTGWGSFGVGVWTFDLRREQWSHLQSDFGSPVMVVVDSTGKLYARVQNGFYANIDGAWQPLMSTNVTVAAADQHGSLWLGSQKLGTLWYYQAGQLTSFGQPFDANGLNYLLVDSHDQLWAAYSDRLLRYTHGEWQTIASPVYDIDRIVAGPDGRIWITGRRSVSVISDASIAVYDPAVDQQP